jgi:hypothetical protein
MLAREQPYKSITPATAVVPFVEEGGRLPMPDLGTPPLVHASDTCVEFVMGVIAECHASDVNKRPTFKGLTGRFEQMMESAGEGCNQERGADATVASAELDRETAYSSLPLVHDEQYGMLSSLDNPEYGGMG